MGLHGCFYYIFSLSWDRGAFACNMFVPYYTINLLNKKEDPDPDLDPGLAPGPGPRPGSSEIRVSAPSITGGPGLLQGNFIFSVRK